MNSGSSRAPAKPLGLKDAALVGEALAALAAASLAVRLLPFRRVAARASRLPKRRARGKADVARTRQAVAAAMRRVPWRALCFQSALALQSMLRRRGVLSLLHYGIAQEGGIKAHVWLSVDGEIVLGGEEAPRYAEVATFPPTASR